MLYLVHHADALPPDVDPRRALSVAGRTHVDDLARRAAGRGARPAAIWHSGKLRARQTAEAFWRACNPLAELAAIRGLQPTDPPQWIGDRLMGETREVMVVGHMPSLPRILALLVQSGPDAALQFPLHGLVALEDLDGRWVEQWREV